MYDQKQMNKPASKLGGMWGVRTINTVNTYTQKSMKSSIFLLDIDMLKTSHVSIPNILTPNVFFSECDGNKVKAIPMHKNK